MAYILAAPTVQQYVDANGLPLANGSIEFFIWNTSTPTPVYSDDSGTSLGTSVTLNSIGAPQSSGGTPVALFFDDSVAYKIVRKDAAGDAIDPTIGPFRVIADSSARTVDTTTSLKAIQASSFSGGESRWLTESGKAGLFVWTLGNFTTESGNDTTGGFYVKADDVAVTVGMWVRRYDEPINSTWFSVAVGGGDTTAAMQAMAATAGRGYVLPGDYNLSTDVTGSYFSDGAVTFSGAGKFKVTNTAAHPAVPASSRSIIQYKNATSVYLRDTVFPMSGFRFQGAYRKSNVPIMAAASQLSVISTATDLAFGMSSVVLENWYAVFAVANEGDVTCTFELVPFLRVKSALGGGQFDLNKAGEAIHTAVAQTYTWAADALNGAECLVITETVDGRAINWSGRETTITDSTTTTVTLADGGTVGVHDWLLPAPVGYDHYRYCGSFYFDTGEVRNIADDGVTVRSRGISDQSGTNTGSVTNEVRKPAGYICPLATSVIINSYCELSTTGTGQYVENYLHDSGSHDISSLIFEKTAAFAHPIVSHDVVMPLTFGPEWYFDAIGAMAVQRINGQQRYYGWQEP